MTHHPVRVEADGTRVYANYHRYKPKGETKRNVRKPDNPDAIRWKSDWLLPLPLIGDNSRVMPDTRPDDQALEHRAWCRCEVCARPAARALRRRWLLYGKRPTS
jgi:hypothetical protein